MPCPHVFRSLYKQVLILAPEIMRFRCCCQMYLFFPSKKMCLFFPNNDSGTIQHEALHILLIFRSA